MRIASRRKLDDLLLLLFACASIFVAAKSFDSEFCKPVIEHMTLENNA